MKFINGLALCAALLGGQSAMATTLDGDTVGGQALFNFNTYNAFNSPVTNGAPVNAVVGSGVEYSALSSSVDLRADLSGNTLTLEFESLIDGSNFSSAFNFVFSDLDFATGVLSGFTVLSNNGWTNFYGVTTTADSVTLSFGGQSLPARATKTFTGRFDVTVPPVPAVPLPAGVWMLLAGLGGLGLMRRRAAKS